MYAAAEIRLGMFNFVLSVSGIYSVMVPYSQDIFPDIDLIAYVLM
jgi:hypothetical protein